MTKSCITCAAGFVVSNGTCVKNTACTTSQYKNSNGDCVNGNVANCQSYLSPNGECAACNTGFKFNANFSCIASAVTCPNATSTARYFVSGNTCVKTDARCTQANSDGSCAVC